MFTSRKAKQKIMFFAVAVTVVFFVSFININPVTYKRDVVEKIEEKIAQSMWPESLDTKEYDRRLLDLASYTPPSPVVVSETREDGTVATTTKIISDLVYSDTHNVTAKDQLYPARAVYPHGGAILPFKRILAYYGNFYSTRMGILGEFEPDVVLQKLRETQVQWEAADPNTPVMPAIHYIVMVAQANPGSDGMYRALMPDEEIEKAYQMAKQIEGILFLDLQVGKSSIQTELPKIKKFIERPDVHVGIDPEFSMKSGNKPGTVIGTFDAQDINFVIEYMSEIVREHKLPPKVLVIHRFTSPMVTNFDQIKPTPEVQVVMHMDGWGPKDLKRGTYDHIVAPEPVQFTGVKIFYKNDLKEPSTGILTPEETLLFDPKPMYIQYQ